MARSLRPCRWGLFGTARHRRGLPAGHGWPRFPTLGWTDFTVLFLCLGQHFWFCWAPRAGTAPLVTPGSFRTLVPPLGFQWGDQALGFQPRALAFHHIWGRRMRFFLERSHGGFLLGSAG